MKILSTAMLAFALAIGGSIGAAHAEGTRPTTLSDWASGSKSKPWADGGHDTDATRVKLSNCHYTLVGTTLSGNSPKQIIQLQKRNIIGIYDSYGNKTTNCGSWSTWANPGSGDYKFQLNVYYTSTSTSSSTTICCFAANPVTIQW
ncbi:hypothetical protein EYE40_09190 [Glaciihabitans arcticus]|uniref:Secreted protein n=1 Tax=Glaciihabitans arcticus TaxID=2668039 RepID=A0A4Q9GVE8_9MICO|nr:hypothetical protein [Glaciihabitans arcticus]TBN57548.1 hypothetical protein EYE40_09190 [Glaciihabitans arcticus]